MRAMPILRFRCPDCGFSDYEVGHLTTEDQIHCVICLRKRIVRLHRWEEEGEGAYARLRLAAA